jgi:AAA domain
LTEQLATRFSDIDPLPAIWTWRQRVPVAELTILAAPGGTGKGILCADLAARISRGEALPDGGPPEELAPVLMVSSEDDRHVVVVNRLIAAGADLGMIADLSMVDGAPFTLPEHAGALRQALDELPGCRLVILDPLAGLCPFPLTSVARVRGVLAPLQRIASDTGVSILLTHHTTKAGQVAGSAAVKDAVRSVLVIERDSSNPSVRCVRSVKSNMGSQDPPVVRFAITGEDMAARVEYLSEPDRPESGQAAILAWLRDSGDLHSGQDIAAAVKISYSTTRVYLARLAAKGLVVSPARGWFAAVSDAPGVTTAAQGPAPVTSVASLRGGMGA